MDTISRTLTSSSRHHKDANFDKDLFQIAEIYVSTTLSSNWNPNSDFNGDNRVEIFDISELARNYGKVM